MIDINEEQIRALFREMWKLGKLRGLLLEHQKPLYDHYYSVTLKKIVWLCSRRFGKSAGFVVLASETCIRRDGAKVRYGASTQKMVEELIVPIIQLLIETAPKEFRPEWVSSKGKLFFPQTPNSQVVISGLDEGRADRLRGTDMDLGIIDEAQDVDDLDYVIRSVLMPQTLTTEGRIILGGTSPKTAAHPFTNYVHNAEREGALIKRTIYDDSRAQVLARIPEFMREAGGEESTTWRREYLVEIITDEESALIPEFSKPDVRSAVTQELPRPPFFIPYTVVDLGLIDYTAAVFGYVDFLKGKKVILDEFLINRKDSKYIADAILSKERNLWGVDIEGKPLLKPRRYVDGAALTVQDFNSLHNLACSMVAKDELDAMVNELRLDCASAKLQIHPRCVETLKQLQYGIWNKNHTSFDRSSAYGHFDLVAAVMYYIRHANVRENPYPLNYGLEQSTHFISDLQTDSTTKKSLKQAFGIPK